MKMGSIAAGLAALAMVTTPLAASAAESMVARSAAPVEGEGIAGTSTMGLALLGAIVLVAGIVIIADDDDDGDEPVSP